MAAGARPSFRRTANRRWAVRPGRRHTADSEAVVAVPPAVLGGHAADDLVLPQQVAVVGGPVLAALIRGEEQLLRFHSYLLKHNW